MSPLSRRATSLFVLAGVAALAVAAPSTASFAAAPPCLPPVALVNGSFELPRVDFADQFSQADVPGWSTTAGDGAIEIWGDNYQGVPGAGAEGDQFIEVEANNPSTAMYQDVATTPGQALLWSVSHRGRFGGDQMLVQLGPTTGPLDTQGDTISDGTGTWSVYTGVYVVPLGQTTTRIALQGLISDGNPGNLVDDVRLAGAACMAVTTTVSGTKDGSASAGQELGYTVAITNSGGVTATGLSVRGLVPAGTTLVPGSLSSVPKTVAAGATRTVRLRVTVDAGAAGTSIRSAARVGWTDLVLTDRTTSAANTVTTPVVATLAATGVSPVPGLVVGLGMLGAGAALLVVRSRRRAKPRG